MFLQPEGVDGHGGASAGDRAAQHARAGGIGDVEFFVGRADVPLDEVIQEIVGERDGGTAGGAVGDVTPAIVTARVDGPIQVGAGGAQGMGLERLDGLPLFNKPGT